MKRVNIFVGEFGSGKTELTLNYALQLRKEFSRVAVVDLDLVKPLFRARENQQLLQAQDIILAAPPAQFTASDLPIMPQALPQLLADETTQLVIDVGGNEASIALAQYAKMIDAAGYNALMVVNTYRPFTSNSDDIIKIMQTVEHLSKLEISAFICNSNLGNETKSEHIAQGIEIMEQVALQTGKPLEKVIVPHWLSSEWTTCKYQTMEFQPYTRYPWLEEENK